MNPMNTDYWNTINLANSLTKTPSFESLTEEEKLQRRVSKLEELVESCTEIYKANSLNYNKFQDRMLHLRNTSPEYMKHFYEESPNYQSENMVDALIWLSYSDKEKANILDNDLEEYFN